MCIIGTKILLECAKKHADVRGQLSAWNENVLRAVWTEPADVKALYSTASFLPDNRVVFNIKGNNYRIVTQINYELGVVQIRFAGTHPEYDKIDAARI